MYIKKKLKNNFKNGLLAFTNVGTITSTGDTLRIDVEPKKYYKYDFSTDTWYCVSGIFVKQVDKLPNLNLELRQVIQISVFDIILKSEYADFTGNERREYVLAHYRKRRAEICFPVINRGKLWYDTLTEAKLEQLENWYYAWLDVTATLTEPSNLYWLNEKIVKQEDIVL